MHASVRQAQKHRSAIGAVISSDQKGAAKRCLLENVRGDVRAGVFFPGAPPFSYTEGRKGMKGKLPHNANIDLGLAILASTSKPPHTAHTIAAYCGCSRQCIQQIEKKALRKIRAALYRNKTLGEGFENELQGLSRK